MPGLRPTPAHLLALSLSLLLTPSHAHPTPQEPNTAEDPYEAQPPETQHGRNISTFSRDFATALAVAAVAVAVGTTLICVFAHCWRQILDWGLESSGAKRRRPPRKDEEVWFCGADRGMPAPRFEALASVTEFVPLSPAMTLSALDPEREFWLRGDDGVPAVYARHVSVGSRGRYLGGCEDGVPCWLDAEEVERPASVAYFLDRP
ncbi:hypothetical protein F4861DRAFT_538347 [Xylaria intraflava]|nr:hypothetical protein F4861DRAFT_538347 [Xylaria intraflava]